MASASAARSRKKGSAEEQAQMSERSERPQRSSEVSCRKIAGVVLRLCLGVGIMYWFSLRNSADTSIGIPPPSKVPVFIPVDEELPMSKCDEFLSPEEVAYLLRFADEGGGWSPRPESPEYEIPMKGFIAAAREDPIVARVEARIDNLTGIPGHPHEDIVSLARITTRGREPRGGHYPPYGLHHDSDTRPDRVWSVLVYLEVPEEGGRTIFPLVGERRKATADLTARHQELEAGLQEHFGGEESGYRRQVNMNSSLDHPMNDLLEESCRGDYGFSFLPKPGGALLFPSGNMDRETWHAGCNVLQGAKIILQKFKERPLREREEQDIPDVYQPFVQ
eukprot:TRINITY_DN47218_c0_g1_i1.p1 TRINITY_DN47218_c0_g1~~TRINITY_DN47218_c0_g1_i1.p1  ORF type:complete len:335 (+),score=36.87 TRINITY_DN47218_c0_g1_i1:44-1048(+)